MKFVTNSSKSSLPTETPEGIFIGLPKATDVYTEEELVIIGMVGVYVDDSLSEEEFTRLMRDFWEEAKSWKKLPASLLAEIKKVELQKKHSKEEE